MSLLLGVTFSASHHFLHNTCLVVMKRPGGDTDQVKVKQRVELQDDGGQESDVEMDLPGPSVQGPQGTDVQLGLSPPTGQVASDGDFAVPGKLGSRMVKDERNPSDHAALDAQILEIYSQSLVPLVLSDRKAVLLGILVKITRQNDYDTMVEKILNTHGWLQDFLIGQWQEKSFTNARRLSECPLYAFPVNSVA